MHIAKVFSFLAAFSILAPLSIIAAEAQDFRSSDQFSARYNSFSDSLSNLGFQMSKRYNDNLLRQAQWQSINSPPTELSDPFFAAAIKKQYEKQQQQQQQQNQQSNNASNPWGLPDFGLPNYGLGGSVNNNPFFSSQGASLFDNGR